MRQMVKVETKIKHRYDRELRKPGDVYDARLSDLRFLQRAGWAILYQEVAVPADDIPDYTPKPKRHYRRRDLKAE